MLLYLVQGKIQSYFLGGLNCLFHVKRFLTLLFAIGNIAVWRGYVLDTLSRAALLRNSHYLSYISLAFV